MALQQIPLCCSCRSSSLHFLLFQPPQTHHHATLKFRVSSSATQLASQQQVKPVTPAETAAAKNKKKKKNSSRPSFFDQIQDKWSHKLGSQTDKFPWQRQQEPEEEEEEEEQQQLAQHQEQEEEREEEFQNKSSQPSYRLDFQFPKRLSPWPQAENPHNPRFDSESDASEDEVRDNVKPLRQSAVVEREGNSGEVSEEGLRERVSGVRKRRSNAELAERLIPEHELRRLRKIALRMMERFEVGVAGITQELVASIHQKWRDSEVVKLKFEAPLAANMRRAHQILETKTGGIVVWRSGSSIVLYRGMAYKLPCVKLYTEMNHAKEDNVLQSVHVGRASDAQASVKETVGTTTESFTRDSAEYLKDMSEEEFKELTDLDHLLDELGPRFIDWTGRVPLPVDADLLPAVVPGYKTPFRLLPYGVKHCLTNREMTAFRRLARTTAPHFALGRNRELQGLARAMVKLWETSAISKIVIKRGVHHTCNERMAEELRKLTGGTVLSRNKEYIVFYRGNDFLPPAVTNVLTEREKLTFIQQDEEEKAREIASPIMIPDSKASQMPLFAGTLAETRAATTNWGRQPSKQEVEKMTRDSALNRLSSLIKNHEIKIAITKGKFRKADKDLAKLQGDLDPADLPSDLETLTTEERFLYRKIGLSMKPFLVLGRRDVYAGTIENMHLHWKYRELVKIIVKGRNMAQVKHIAVALEAESGGVLVSVDKDTTKGYIIIVYRGKNYFRPRVLRPKSLLTKRQALARSIVLQRREALKDHMSDLEDLVGLLKSELEDMKNEEKIDGDKTLYSSMQSYPVSSDDEFVENEESEIRFDEAESGDD